MFKKLFAGLATVAVVTASLAIVPSANGALNDPEFNSALSWAYDLGLTKYNTEEGFNPYGTLTREQFTKFASAYAVSNLCLEADTSMACDFSDVPADPSLGQYVKLACQLGLVKGSDGKFMPTNPITKAELATVLSRAISAAAGEAAPSEDGQTPWWNLHFKALQALGVTKETDAYALDRSVTRYEALLMMYRSRVESPECAGSVDITDLLEDIFGGNDDTDATDSDDSDDDTSDDVATDSDGSVMASLSSSTPNGASVPQGVSAHVASFDFTASDDDVVLNDVVIERFGLGNDDAVQDLTLFVGDEVVSKSKKFNSDQEATINFIDGGIVVKKGETVTVDVIVTVGQGAGISNQEFIIALSDFSSNGNDHLDDLPIKANQFEIAGVSGALVIVTADGNISDVELGQKGVEISKFEIENKSNDTVYITNITLEDDNKNIDDNLSNFVLKHDNKEVAMNKMSNGKYLSFQLSSPVMIGENETENFKIFADVNDGAGDKISLFIDENIYVRGYDKRYGFGLRVDFGTNPYCSGAATDCQEFVIDAGEITLAENKAIADEIRPDRDNNVLASFDLNINSGKDLSLEDIKFVIEGDPLDTGTYGDDIFEDVELHITVDGTTRSYDLDSSDDSATGITFSDRDLGIYLPDSGDIVIELVGDTRDFIVDDYVGDNSVSFTVKLDTDDGFEIIENLDDKVVTDISPSTITFDAIEIIDSSVLINGISLSDVDVVKGAKNVDVVMFEIETDDVSAVEVDGFILKGDTLSGSSLSVVDRKVVSALRLWKKTNSGWELLDEESGSSLNSEEINFDSFSTVIVPSSSTQLFLVTVDVTDDDANEGTKFSFELSEASIDDDDNNSLCTLDNTLCGGASVNSKRDIVVTGAGELNIKVDNNDSETNRTRHVLAGTEPADFFVASFEMIAINEGVEIEDMELVVVGSGTTDFDAAVLEVVIYANDKTTELYRERISGTPVKFNNINLVLPEGSSNLYVNIVADAIGKNANGVQIEDVSFALSVSGVTGDDSGEDATVLYEGVVGMASNPSRVFDIIPVHISNVEVTNKHGTIGTNQLSDGDNILGVIEVTANSWSTTNVGDNSDVEVTFAGGGKLAFTVSTSETIATGGVTVERMDLSGGDKVCDTTVSGSKYTVNFATCDPNIAEIEEGVTAQYRVEVNIPTVASTNASAQIRFDDLNNGDVAYKSTDTASSVISQLRLDKTTVFGEKKTVSN